MYVGQCKSNSKQCVIIHKVWRFIISKMRPCHPALLWNLTRLTILPEGKLKRFTSFELLFVSGLTSRRRARSVITSSPLQYEFNSLVYFLLVFIFLLKDCISDRSIHSSKGYKSTHNIISIPESLIILGFVRDRDCEDIYEWTNGRDLKEALVVSLMADPGTRLEFTSLPTTCHNPYQKRNSPGRLFLWLPLLHFLTEWLHHGSDGLVLAQGGLIWTFYKFL
jgi:hypothetical protein